MAEKAEIDQASSKDPKSKSVEQTTNIKDYQSLNFYPSEYYMKCRCWSKEKKLILVNKLHSQASVVGKYQVYS